MEFEGKQKPANADEFVAMWRAQAEASLEEYLHPDSQSYIGMPEENLSDQQVAKIEKVARMLVMEQYLHILLGLAGSPVAGVRQRYEIRDEAGNLICSASELHEAAISNFND